MLSLYTRRRESTPLVITLPRFRLSRPSGSAKPRAEGGCDNQGSNATGETCTCTIWLYTNETFRRPFALPLFTNLPLLRRVTSGESPPESQVVWCGHPHGRTASQSANRCRLIGWAPYLLIYNFDNARPPVGNRVRAKNSSANLPPLRTPTGRDHRSLAHHALRAGLLRRHDAPARALPPPALPSQCADTRYPLLRAALLMPQPPAFSAASAVRGCAAPQVRRSPRPAVETMAMLSHTCRRNTVRPT